MKTMPILACTLALLVSSHSSASIREEMLAGPMTGDVIQILDGDTLNVSIRVWIGQKVETSVRIDGIDAPEIKGKCEKEREMATAAQQELARLVADGRVRIYNVRLEKYAGRVLAQAETTNGINIAQHMIEKGFVRPYHGEKREPWCMNNNKSQKF